MSGLNHLSTFNFNKYATKEHQSAAADALMSRAASLERGLIAHGNEFGVLQVPKACVGASQTAGCQSRSEGRGWGYGEYAHLNTAFSNTSTGSIGAPCASRYVCTSSVASTHAMTIQSEDSIRCEPGQRLWVTKWISKGWVGCESG